jgi:hypothetical protein
MQTDLKIKTYCITLENSKRIEEVKREFEKQKLDVTIIVRKRDFENGIRGCFESHLYAINLGITNNADVIVIFEDDVEFDTRKKFDNVKSAIEYCLPSLSLNEFEVIGLGGFAMRPFQYSTQKNIFKTKFTMSHAYIISKDAAFKMSKWKYDYTHYDQCMMKRLNQGLMFPSIAFQKSRLHGELTTTGSSKIYIMLTFVRNLLSSYILQIVIEYAAFVVGFIQYLIL